MALQLTWMKMPLGEVKGFLCSPGDALRMMASSSVVRTAPAISAALQHSAAIKSVADMGGRKGTENRELKHILL